VLAAGGYGDLDVDTARTMLEEAARWSAIPQCAFARPRSIWSAWLAPGSITTSSNQTRMPRPWRWVHNSRPTSAGPTRAVHLTALGPGGQHNLKNVLRVVIPVPR
jgi:hypothetical protein